MRAYYNEFDPKAAAWLRQLIKNGDIADGFVDKRSIIDVRAEELRGFTQHHFFAGIGVWSYALRKSGWSDDKPVWTASLPCQPFSCAGNQKGKDDERHLLPHFLELVKQCKPDTLFGEQVESAIRHEWLDDLQANMEAEGYAVGHCILGAHSVNAAHIRKRLYWVAARGLSDSALHGDSGSNNGVADSNGLRPERECREGKEGIAEHCKSEGASSPGTLSESIEWLYCRDNKYRPIKSFSFEMASRAARIMGCCCNPSTQENAEKEGEINDSENKTDTCKILSVVQQEAGKKSAQERIAGFDSFQEKEVLRQGLHGERLRGESESRELTKQSLAVKEDSEGIMRGVWEKLYVACASCGRESFKQLNIEFDDVMREMPQGSTLKTLFGGRGAEYLLALRQASDEKQPLLDSQYSLSEIWKSTNDEDKERVRMAFSNRGWMISRAIEPLVDGVARGMVHRCGSIITPNDSAEARTQRLKGYGNAIQAEVAVEFISAFMDVIK